MTEQRFVEYLGISPADFAAVRSQIDAVLRANVADASWRYANDYGDQVGEEGTSLKVARPDGWGGLDSLSIIDSGYCDAFSTEGTVWDVVVTEVLDVMRTRWESAHPDDIRPFFASAATEGASEDASEATPTIDAALTVQGGKQASTSPTLPRQSTPIPSTPSTDDLLLIEYSGFPAEYFPAVKGALEEAIRNRYADDEWRYIATVDGGNGEDVGIAGFVWTPGEYNTWFELADKDAQGRPQTFAVVSDDYCLATYKPGTRWGDTVEELLAIMNAHWENPGESASGHYTESFFVTGEDDEDDWDEEDFD